MDGISAAASGLHSAGLRLATSAHNVANLTTRDFRPLRAVQFSSATGGSEVRVDRAASPRDVDLAREVIEQISAKTQFNGSLRALNVGLETRSTLIDLFA